MMHLQDTDLLKDIPGYQAILRVVLKSQIQLLVEQLSDATGEESILLTASVSDETHYHLGSTSGKDFLKGREEIKFQFLRYCLKKRHKLSMQDGTEVAPASKECSIMPPQSQGHTTPVSTLQVPRNKSCQTQSPYKGEITNQRNSPRNLPVNRSSKVQMKHTTIMVSTDCPVTTARGKAGEDIVKAEVDNAIKLMQQQLMEGQCNSADATNLEPAIFNSEATTQASPQVTCDTNINRESGVEPDIDSNLSTQSVGSNFDAVAIVKKEGTDDDLEISPIEPGMIAEVSQMSYQGDWAPDMGGDEKSVMEIMNVGNESQAGYKRKHSLQDDTEASHDSKQRRTMPPRSVKHGQAGEVIVKSEIMENKTEIMQNKSEIMQNKSEIMENKSEIMENKSEIMENKSEIMENKSEIMENKSEIMENKSEIMQNTDAPDDSASMPTTFVATNSEKIDFSVASAQASSQGTSDTKLNKVSDVELSIDSNLSTKSYGSDLAAGTIAMEEATEDDLEITPIEPGMSAEVSQMSYQCDFESDIGSGPGSTGPGSTGGDEQSEIEIEMVYVGNQSQVGYRQGKLRPGTIKAVDSEEEEFINRRHALRQKKTRAMAALMKLSDKLQKEQILEPVETLFVLYETTTTRLKYCGNGKLLRNFIDVKPLTDKPPVRNNRYGTRVSGKSKKKAV